MALIAMIFWIFVLAIMLGVSDHNWELLKWLGYIAIAIAILCFISFLLP